MLIFNVELGLSKVISDNNERNEFERIFIHLRGGECQQSI